MAITLKACRVNKNLTQEDVAKVVDVSKDTISNWERGVSFPNVPQIKLLLDLYQVSYDDIIFLPDNSV